MRAPGRGLPLYTRPSPTEEARSRRFLLWGLIIAALTLAGFTLCMRLPRQKAMLEDEFERLIEHHRLGHAGGAACDCSHPTGLGGAPLLCRLGLPPPEAAGAAGSGSGGEAAAGDGGGADTIAAEQQQQQQQQQQGADGALGQAAAGADPQQQEQQQQQQQQQQGERQHRLAVLIPYRDREPHLAALLRELRPYLERQGRAHDVFVLEQGDSFLFNRGALLNAGALLLAGSDYDYYVFQDVDTIPLDKGGIQYSFPKGAAPLHLTPHWIHPKSTYVDFFGGLLIMTAEQFRRINGFGTQFWGWGREDDNLRDRLVRAGMWPPEYPPVPQTASLLNKRSYFQHQRHKQAAELRAAEADNGTVTYFEANPRLPYRGAKIMSSQPQFLQDFETGLNTTMFSILSMQPFFNATKISLQLHCNVTATPWCRPEAIGQRQAPAVRHAAAVHAVSGSRRRR